MANLNAAISDSDRAILQVLDEGALSLQISCEECDMASHSQTTAQAALKMQFLLCPRHQYLFPALRGAIDYFALFCIDSRHASDFWIEHSGLVLKPNLPMGLLYDLCGQPPLPWQLKIHFQPRPPSLATPSAQQCSPALMAAQTQIKCQSLPETEKSYFQGLKQALYLVNGSTRAYYALSVEEQKKVWKLVLGCDVIGVKEILTAILPAKDSDIRYIPVRLYRTRSMTMVQYPVSTKMSDNCVTTAEPLKSSNARENTTIGCIENTPQQQAITIASAIRCLLQTSEQECCAMLETHRVVIQGIEMPPESPLIRVWRLFAHLDLFLNICITPRF